MRGMHRHLRTHDVGAVGALFLSRSRTAQMAVGGHAVPVRDSHERRAALRRVWTPSCAPRCGRVARVPQLLVACDYDGTLAPSSTTRARPTRCPRRSPRSGRWPPCRRPPSRSSPGRALRDLATLSRLPSEVHLVGSHGSEFDLGFIQRLAPELIELRDRLRGELSEHRRRARGRTARDQAGEHRGAYRGVERRSAHASAGRPRRSGKRGPASTSPTARRSSSCRWSPPTREGRRRAAHAGVGQRGAVHRRRHHRREPFAQLHGPDVGIKIGTRRHPGPPPGRRSDRGGPGAGAAARAPPALALRRAGGADRAPLDADRRRTVALVTPDTRVTWLCHPRPDSAAIFADLLGGTSAGHFTSRPRP